ncbi:MAG TPA: BON domain-containing protein [Candidatus Angelobacter sp.]|nr:BON domain-containing protein [Candidatus Angelobacter sp.]
MRHLDKLALIAVMGSGLAIAQGMPQSSAPQTTAPSASQSPVTPDQQQPSTAPSTSPSSTTPANPSDQLPNTDQKSNTTPSASDSSKLPQSDAAPTANGDVQGNIQSAIQKDPSLANANVNVAVTGKTVELNGTVPTKDAKDNAERIAKDNANGMKIKNHIKVASNSDNSMPKTDTSTNPSNPK